jgi:hypothetical protein
MSMSPPPETLGLGAEPIDMKQAMDTRSDDHSDQDKNLVAISSINKNEPLVTRRELWSYYRTCWYTPMLFPDEDRRVSVLQW